MYMWRSLLIFSNVNFKMAARRPYWIFLFRTLIYFSLVLNINSKLKWHNRAYWFSATSLSKWPSGGHIGFFGLRTLTLVWLWISTPNFSGTILIYIWVRAYWFSMTSFSKWLPGGHIKFFGFWTAWFRQRNSSLLWNFSFKFHVHVLCGSRQKPDDCQLCRFQNGCLAILNNVQLQSTHCPLPSPMGREYPCWSLIYNF